VLRQAIARGVSLAAIQIWNESRAKADGRNSRLPVLSKLAMSRLLHTTAQVRRDILGAGAMLDSPDSADWYQTNFLTLNAYFTSIGGGTDQIQRSIIGERALGLPREPSADHGVPFREVRKPGTQPRD
jgi:alkylation response protein AidB-like acyl-CoA dehydrogenase